MEIVKVTKNGVTKNIEKGALPIWAMRGWTLAKNTGKSQATPQKPAPKGSPYDPYGNV